MSYFSKPRYIDNLMILRGLCSFGVLFTHCLTICHISILKKITENAYVAQSLAGRLAALFWPCTAGNFVYIFFIHSGYLMGKIYWNNQYEISRHSVTEFYKKRFLRIAPLLYFNLFFCMFFLKKAYLIFDKPLSVFGDFFFINNLTGRYINYVTWSLSFEMQDYLICPLFFLCFAKKTVKNLLLCIAVTLAAAVYSFYVQLPPENRIFLNLFKFSWLFLGGYSINLIVRYIHENGRIFGSAGTALAGFALFFITNMLFYSFQNSGFEFPAQAQLLIFSMATILLLELPLRDKENALYQRLSFKILFLRLFTWLGMLSYGVYLWHFPVTIIYDDHRVYIVSAIEKSYNFLSAYFYFPKVIYANLCCLSTILLPTLLISFITFFLIELRFRPNLYNYNDSRLIFPFRDKMAARLKELFKNKVV